MGFLVKVKVGGKWILGKASNGATKLNAVTALKVLHAAQKRHEAAYKVAINAPEKKPTPPPARPHGKTEAELRAEIVKWCLWSVEHAAQIHYPPGDVRTQGLPDSDHLPQTIDCSQHATWMNRLTKDCPDPNGGDYRAGESMYTGSLLDHNKHIKSSDIKHGDKIVYGAYPGDHVVTAVGDWANGDCKVVSHGQEVDPIETTHSVEHRAHGNGPVTFLALTVK